MNKCVMLVEVDRLVCQPERIRSIAYAGYHAVVASIRRLGYQAREPLVVVSEESESSDYKVEDGNRRVAALQWLRDNEPEEYQRILPRGKMFVEVRESL